MQTLFAPRMLEIDETSGCGTFVKFKFTLESLNKNDATTYIYHSITILPDVVARAKGKYPVLSLTIETSVPIVYTSSRMKIGQCVSFKNGNVLIERLIEGEWFWVAKLPHPDGRTTVRSEETMESEKGDLAISLQSKYDLWVSRLQKSFKELSDFKLPNMPSLEKLHTVEHQLNVLEKDFLSPLAVLRLDVTEDIAKLKESAKGLKKLQSDWKPWLTVLRVVKDDEGKLEKMVEWIEANEDD